MRRLLFYIFVLSGLTMMSQQLPPNIHWKEMQTEQLRLIYPEHLEKYALKTARFIDSLYPSLIYPLGPTKKIPLILNPYTSVSNAFVSLAPRRSEWYLQPYHRLYFGQVPWYKDLATHEYRHVVQFDAMNDGVIKISRIFGGDIAQLLNMFWAYPIWYFEGDAIDTETRLSNGGRGRSNDFKMHMRMIASEYDKKDLNYYKVYLGSYNRYYPSHYHLGYFMKDYVNRHYGREIWLDIIKSASWTAFIPGSMNLWLKQKTGMDYKQLADSMFINLKQNPPNEKGPQKLLDLPRPEIYTNDLFPHKISKDSLLFLRYGFDNYPSVYLYDFQNKKLQKLISVPAVYFTANHNYMAWTEYKTHPRWQKQTYTRIKVYNLHSRKSFFLTSPAKYQTPFLDPANNLLVVVNYDLNIVPHLEIWDIEKGKKLYDFGFPQFESIRQPSFTGNLQEIVFTALTDRQDISGSSAVYKLNPANGSLEKITHDFVYTNMNYPRIYKGTLYLQTGAKNIWMINPENNEIKIPVSAYYGLESFFVHNDTIYFSEFTKNGFQISRQKTDTSGVISFRVKQITIDTISKHVRTQTTPASYPSQSYKRWKDYFRPHSWIWGIAPASDSTWMASGGLMFNDLLDENAIWLGFVYSTPKDYNLFLNWEYKRFFPVFGVNYYLSDIRSSGNNYANINLYSRIPLNFSRGIWYRHITFQSGISFEKNNASEFAVYSFSTSLSVFRGRAYRNVSSRLGMKMLLKYEAENSTISENHLAKVRIHLPGLGKNTVLGLEGIYRGQTGTYGFMQTDVAVRGSGYTSLKNLSAFRADYHAPLAYPDWGWRKVFNLKRIRFKLFADFARTDRGNWQSTGLQLIGDWNFFALKVDVPLGIQAAYVQPWNQWRFSLVLLDITL